MMIVGLTGGMGSGKSTVADYFASQGIDVIDTDLIARELVKPGLPAYQSIVQHFGQGILKADHELDRAALKQRLINSSDDRARLENILHPLIQQQVEQRLQTVTGHYCIVVIPLLAEKANYPMLNRILVVDCPVALQKQRIRQRDGLDESSIEKLLAIQASREQRLALADDVIPNDGDINALTTAAQKIHEKYMKQ